MTAALLALTALSGCSAAAGLSGGAPGSTPAASSATPSAGQKVAVIGDSIESGLGLEPSEAWPALVAATRGWELENLSVPGAGFVAIGSDGNDFSAQVDAAIAAQVSAAMQKAVQRLHDSLPDARIVGFSALSGQASDSDLAAFDSALQDAVESVGGQWLDLGQPYRGQTGLVQDDDEHPTLPGQQAIAAVVESKLGA
jgi:acyl-CoA thioesterase-1